MSEENAGASGSSELGAQEKPQETLPPTARARSSGRLLIGFTVLVALLSLFAPIAASGIWDPPEREVAELSRRIALNLLGGHNLAVEGANNEVPTRGELGRGELPFTSIAAGFRAFGLHEWAGRLPLAVWGLIGLGATYVLVRRLSDRRTALFAVLALATMPLYFLHARTMLGDIVTMAALAVALAGWGLAVFERTGGEPAVSRYLALGAGVLGAFCALLSRGVLVGIALPTFSVGVSWLVLGSSGVTQRERFGDAIGALSLAIGVIAGVLGCRALYHAPDTAGQFTLWLGSAVNRPRVLPTFDSIVLQLGHALFPWSAVLPVALGALLREPPLSSGPEREREAALRMLALSLPVIGLLVYGIAAPIVGPLPFGAVSALAVAIAIFTRDFERGVKVSRTTPMVAVAFAVLLFVDFKNFPEKGLSAFCVTDVHFPESFKPTAERILELGTLLFSGAFFFLLQERSTHADPRFEAGEYRVWPRTLRELWAGNLQFAILVLEAALLGICVLGFLSDRVLHAGKFDALGATPRAAALGGAIALPLLVLSPTALTLVRDAFRTLFDPELGSLFGSGAVSRWLRDGLSRAQAALFVCVGFGLALSLGYYPILTAQISPKQVFDAYRREARPGEALGMLGSGSATASYYAGRNVPSFDNATHAFEWLAAAHERRWLVIRQSDLGMMNMLYRARQTPPRNLPVLDARSSEILLVSNELGDQHNDNPLEQAVLSSAPHPSHPLDANFGDKLDVLGWDTLDHDGQPMSEIEPGRRYTFVIYYRVVQAITGTWDTFIHIDGFQRRFNGDHPTLEGKYPFNLWRVGDFIADRFDFELEPNFGGGRYQVYFGLYNGNRRLEVRRGRSAENRLEAGYVSVR
jgi:4-amino-4-deoxy-L-arabinose transferase-like glycosyltransferase